MTRRRISGEWITFQVDEVIRATAALPVETLEVHLAGSVGRKIRCLAEPGRSVIHTDPDWQMGNKRLHSLIEAVHTAFSQHRPLILSPDCIWLTIAQGFSHHVTENAEALRGRLVKHQGKRALEIDARDLDFSVRDGWSQAIARFSQAIRENTEPVLHETLLCDFSTTTPVMRTASEVALLDTFSHYFEYIVMCVCGIPEITVLGTPRDWRRVRARLEVLETFGLEWWISRLRPILDEFIAFAEGRPDRAFWKAIYKPAKAYATEAATGWITDLFPYLGDPPNRHRNETLLQPRRDWALPVRKAGLGERGGVCLDDFPSGLSKAAVTARSDSGSSRRFDLLAGFFGVTQEADLALAPLIGWAAVDADLSVTGWAALADRFPGVPADADAESALKGFGRPPELLAFARQYAYLDLDLPQDRWRVTAGEFVPVDARKGLLVFATSAKGQALAVQPARLNTPPNSDLYLCETLPADGGERRVRALRKLEGNMFEVLSRIVAADGLVR